MPIVIKQEEFLAAPEGTHLAICYRIADVGTQPDSGFGPKRKIIVTWELCNEMIEIEGAMKPMSVSTYYGFTLHKQSRLRQDLERWRNRAFTKEELKAFNLNAILGKPCQLSILHNEDGRAKVDVVLAVPKGMPIPKPFNGPVEYSIEDGRNDVYKALPEWIRKACEMCQEWKPAQPQAQAAAPAKAAAPDPPASPGDDDIPF